MRFYCVAIMSVIWLPYDPARIDRILLTRAEPDGVGMSPIGGLIDPVGEADDHGLLVDMVPLDQAREGDRVLTAPLSPGLLKTVAVRSVTRVAFGVSVPMAGPGVLALDGDRDHKLIEGHALRVQIRRDGPFVIDTRLAMRWAVAQGMIPAS